MTKRELLRRDRGKTNARHRLCALETTPGMTEINRDGVSGNSNGWHRALPPALPPAESGETRGKPLEQSRGVGNAGCETLAGGASSQMHTASRREPGRGHGPAQGTGHRRHPGGAAGTWERPPGAPGCGRGAGKGAGKGSVLRVLPDPGKGWGGRETVREVRAENPCRLRFQGSCFSLSGSSTVS